MNFICKNLENTYLLTKNTLIKAYLHINLVVICKKEIPPNKLHNIIIKEKRIRTIIIIKYSVKIGVRLNLKVND